MPRTQASSVPVVHIPKEKSATERSGLYKRATHCRACQSKHMVSIVDLGEQALTGVFPDASAEDPPSGPLELLFCPDCTLVQLAHEYQSDVMYGDNYGYRSGLNQSMVNHLADKVHLLCQQANVQSGDWVLDIGSNDGTTLASYTVENLNRVGIDPTSRKFRQYYPDDIHVVSDFFSADAFRSVAGERKAMLVTSIAMFYDLPDPIGFASDINEILADDGVWHFEQSYMPGMLRLNSYDTICQEHLLYYSLHSVKFILDHAGFKILDLSFNDTNGGSFAVSAIKQSNPRTCHDELIDWVLESEETTGITRADVFLTFNDRVRVQTEMFIGLLERLRSRKRTVIGYGASTKGNVILQYANIDTSLVNAIAEINPDKFGCVTPQTRIPIISDTEARKLKPDYFVVFPWHFRHDILRREQEYLRGGGHFIFPLPETEVV
ncbi:class I SAM-dependent methyltransferase [Poriferisphaera sp. WC338]|uniref:class I SAM-dependent methyltransferase n=1 Tax=Poriferisphaera sp. WC338 TaxID=3425129 RepID=UPI003D81B6A1